MNEQSFNKIASMVATLGSKSKSEPYSKSKKNDWAKDSDLVNISGVSSRKLGKGIIDAEVSTFGPSNLGTFLNDYGTQKELQAVSTMSDIGSKIKEDGYDDRLAQAMKTVSASKRNKILQSLGAGGIGALLASKGKDPSAMLGAAMLAGAGTGFVNTIRHEIAKDKALKGMLTDKERANLDKLIKDKIDSHSKSVWNADHTNALTEEGLQRVKDLKKRDELIKQYGLGGNEMNNKQAFSIVNNSFEKVAKENNREDLQTRIGRDRILPTLGVGAATAAVTKPFKKKQSALVQDAINTIAGGGKSNNMKKMLALGLGGTAAAVGTSVGLNELIRNKASEKYLGRKPTKEERVKGQLKGLIPFSTPVSQVKRIARGQAEKNAFDIVDNSFEKVAGIGNVLSGKAARNAKDAAKVIKDFTANNANAAKNPYFQNALKKANRRAMKESAKTMAARTGVATGAGAALGAGAMFANKAKQQGEKTAFEVVDNSFDKVAASIGEILNAKGVNTDTIKNSVNTAASNAQRAQGYKDAIKNAQRAQGYKNAIKDAQRANLLKKTGKAGALGLGVGAALGGGAALARRFSKNQEKNAFDIVEGSFDKVAGIGNVLSGKNIKDAKDNLQLVNKAMKGGADVPFALKSAKKALRNEKLKTGGAYAGIGAGLGVGAGAAGIGLRKRKDK